MDRCGMMMTTMDNGAIFTTCGCMGGSAHGNWYRFACYRGSMETTRFNTSELQIHYNSFTCPEGQEKTQIYTQAAVAEYMYFYNFERINIENGLTPDEIRSKAA